MSHVLTTTFHARAEADWQEIDRKAREIADRYFPNRTYSISVDVTDVRSVSDEVLHKTVEVTAAL